MRRVKSASISGNAEILLEHSSFVFGEFDICGCVDIGFIYFLSFLVCAYLGPFSLFQYGEINDCPAECADNVIQYFTMKVLSNV